MHQDERDRDTDELTRTLLGSMRQDVAPSHAKRATLTALGIGVTTTALTGSVTALAGVARVGALAIAKALAGGALAGAVVVGTASYVQHGAPSRTTESLGHLVPSPMPVATRPVSNAPPDTQPAEPEALHDQAQPSKEVAAAPSVPRPRLEIAGPSLDPSPPALPAPQEPAAAPAVAPHPSTLTLEITLLDDAGSALAHGDSSQALRLLDVYDRQFAGGSLGPEAVVLRIDALLRQRNVTAARALAERFERSRPNDSHLSRIRSLLAGQAAR